ncbi:hypothetical protein YC2023_005675 [Brassica napus]
MIIRTFKATAGVLRYALGIIRRRSPRREPHLWLSNRQRERRQEEVATNQRGRGSDSLLSGEAYLKSMLPAGKGPNYIFANPPEKTRTTQLLFRAVRRGGGERNASWGGDRRLRKHRRPP